MPLREYRCQNGHVYEELRPLEDYIGALSCPYCGLMAQRLVSRSVQLNPPTGAALRSHFRLYQEATQEIDHAYTRAEADLERPIASPDLWGMAKSRARAMAAAGEAPPIANPNKE